MLTITTTLALYLAIASAAAQRPTVIPRPTAVPRPTVIPRPTIIPRPTAIPRPTVIPRPTAIPRPTVVPRPSTAPRHLFIHRFASSRDFSPPKNSTLTKERIGSIHSDSLFNSNASPNNISYTLGAQVITNPVTVYYIYYGAWATSQKAIVEDFTKGVGGSDWWNIEKNYYYQASAASPKIYVDGTVKLGATVTDNYSLGRSLSGNDVPNLIQRYISSGALPESSDAVYFVLISSDVSERIRPDVGPASFCLDYCGYHLSTTLSSGTRVFYGVTGNPPASCIGGCAPPSNQRVSPNGDVGVDAMVSVIAHELAEAVSDPQSDGIRAWQDTFGEENADKCVYTYGATSVGANGGTYNMGWNSRNYLIQQNWEPISQTCMLGIAGSTPAPTTTTASTSSTTTTVAPSTPTTSSTTTTIPLSTSTSTTRVISSTMTSSSTTPTTRTSSTKGHPRKTNNVHHQETIKLPNPTGIAHGRFNTTIHMDRGVRRGNPFDTDGDD
ncbi:hypothetical protein BASA62_005943 [Batrachochytrium salamandrivorans]|nr:hypothetical protein BASA62_005943 [Batrachochytrium salamandrivorans]